MFVQWILALFADKEGGVFISRRPNFCCKILNIFWKQYKYFSDEREREKGSIFSIRLLRSFNKP